jgi:large subunit ribosomal protein L21
MAGYAIIKLGGKQYVVREGEKLLVDRLDVAENKTFHPDVLFEGGDGKAELKPKGQHVTAKVLGHVQGEKIRIGKYRRRTGYRRHTGHRSKLTQIEIQSIGPKRTTAKKDAEEKPKRARSATTSSSKRTTKTKAKT